MSQPDPAAIEADIDATRQRLAATVDELSVRLRPQEIGRRSVQDVVSRVRTATTTADGALRTERVAAIAAAAVALLGFVVLGRRHRR